MSLLYAVALLPVKLTLEIVSRAASAVGVGREDEGGTTVVRVPPQPKYFQPPPPRRSGGNGAGPEIHVDEPWPGYNRMTAADIRDRLRAAPETVAAVVSLYEASRKGRTSVLEAAARGMRGSA